MPDGRRMSGVVGCMPGSVQLPDVRPRERQVRGGDVDGVLASFSAMVQEVRLGLRAVIEPGEAIEAARLLFHATSSAPSTRASLGQDPRYQQLLSELTELAPRLYPNDLASVLHFISTISAPAALPVPLVAAFRKRLGVEGFLRELRPSNLVAVGVALSRHELTAKDRPWWALFIHVLEDRLTELIPRQLCNVLRALLGLEVRRRAASQTERARQAVASGVRLDFSTCLCLILCFAAAVLHDGRCRRGTPHCLRAASSASSCAAPLAACRPSRLPSWRVWSHLCPSSSPPTSAPPPRFWHGSAAWSSLTWTATAGSSSSACSTAWRACTTAPPGSTTSTAVCKC